MPTTGNTNAQKRNLAGVKEATDAGPKTSEKKRQAARGATHRKTRKETSRPPPREGGRGPKMLGVKR